MEVLKTSLTVNFHNFLQLTKFNCSVLFVYHTTGTEKGLIHLHFMYHTTGTGKDTHICISNHHKLAQIIIFIITEDKAPEARRKFDLNVVTWKIAVMT